MEALLLHGSPIARAGSYEGAQPTQMSLASPPGTLSVRPLPETDPDRSM
jgi:hypothetical protein